jgi:hypothetical protein
MLVRIWVAVVLARLVNARMQWTQTDLREVSLISSTIIQTYINRTCLTTFENGDCRHLHVIYGEDISVIASRLRLSYLGTMPLDPVDGSHAIYNVNHCNVLDKNWIGKHYASICDPNKMPFFLLVVDWSPKSILMNHEDTEFWAQQPLQYALSMCSNVCGTLVLIRLK